MRLRAMMESFENVHYIVLSNLWVGKAQGVHVRAHAYCALYSDVRIIPRFSFASGTEAS